jgi:response regulator RpfG family c-di-GMP phosphodiesterase
MPEMRGDEFLRKVGLSHPRSAKILITGKAEENNIPMEELGLSSILYKPWDEQDLFTQVEIALKTGN